MIAYYAAGLPAQEQLGQARADIGVGAFGEPYPRWDGHTCGETYQVGGVECQVGHKVIADLEERTLSLLDGHDPGALGFKAIMGLQSGIPLHGHDLIRSWQTRINAFPHQLARAMVEHYLRELFPIWYFADAAQQRDCAAWSSQSLAETALNVLGILAGLNQKYYVPFQFKRTRRFVEGLAIAPEHLADRLDLLFLTDLRGGIDQVERLVEETIALVCIHMPEVDTAILRHPPGERQQPWDDTSVSTIAPA